MSPSSDAAIKRVRDENISRESQLASQDRGHHHDNHNNEKHSRKRTKDYIQETQREEDRQPSSKRTKSEVKVSSRDQAIRGDGGRNWMASQLRVRIISDRYKKGRYYNKKVRERGGREGGREGVERQCVRVRVRVE